jgi:hypothetical protein
MFPACNFRSATCASPTRSASRLHRPWSVCPNPGPLHHLEPVAGSSPAATGLPDCPAPLQDCYIPQDQSSAFVQPVSPPAGFARFPVAPRRRYLLDRRLRIIVSGQHSAGIPHSVPLKRTISMGLMLAFSLCAASGPKRQDFRLRHTTPVKTCISLTHWAL